MKDMKKLMAVLMAIAIMITIVAATMVYAENAAATTEEAAVAEGAEAENADEEDFSWPEGWTVTVFDGTDTYVICESEAFEGGLGLCKISEESETEYEWNIEIGGAEISELKGLYSIIEVRKQLAHILYE